MPNWTSNKLIFCDEADVICEIVNKLGEKMDFQKIIHRPVDKENNYKDRGEVWGTKWNACRAKKVEIEVLYDNIVSATYEFDTAWDTPREVIKELAEDWPEVEISGGYVHEGYTECGSFHEMTENHREEILKKKAA